MPVNAITWIYKYINMLRRLIITKDLTFHVIQSAHSDDVFFASLHLREMDRQMDNGLVYLLSFPLQWIMKVYSSVNTYLF